MDRQRGRQALCVRELVGYLRVRGRRGGAERGRAHHLRAQRFAVFPREAALRDALRGQHRKAQHRSVRRSDTLHVVRPPAWTGGTRHTARRRPAAAAAGGRAPGGCAAGDSAPCHPLQPRGKRRQSAEPAERYVAGAGTGGRPGRGHGPGGPHACAPAWCAARGAAGL